MAGVLAAAALVWRRLGSNPPTRQESAASPSFRRLTSTGRLETADISPDGEFFLYVEREGGTHRVLVQDLAGSKPLELIRLRRVEATAWSPDGSQVLVSGSETDIESSHVTYVLPRLGGERQFLPIFPYVAWAPDGTAIAGARTNKGFVFVIPTRAGKKMEIPLGGEFPWLKGLAWAPGPRVLVVRAHSENGTHALWLVPLDGSPSRQVVEADHRLGSPRWSPSGDAIYYLDDHGETNDIRRIRVDPRTGEPTGKPATVLAGLKGSGISLSHQPLQ